jgi:sensor histidine kinase regulating citrate/malate metabolism
MLRTEPETTATVAPVEIVTPKGEEVIAVTPSHDGTLVVDLEESHQYKDLKKKSTALYWLLLLAVAVGMLLSVYAVHHFKKSKKNAAVATDLLQDYIEKVRKLQYTDEQIKETLVKHGYSEQEVVLALAPPPPKK